MIPPVKWRFLEWSILLVSSRTARGEYAVMVRSDQKMRGLGRALMNKMIRHARDCGLKTIIGLVHKDNQSMIRMCRKLGFHVPSMIDDYVVGHEGSGDDYVRDEVVQVQLGLE
ncbi:hypothetical protein CCP2SC5_1160010 [Azospirillaceae bacterium]